MSKRILIIDDDKDMLEILSLLLIESGYEIKAVPGAGNIGNLINHFSPDLIVMDVMLKGEDGRTICKSIKKEPGTRSLPVILISGMQDFTGSLQSQDLPDDYLTKPFDLNY